MRKFVQVAVVGAGVLSAGVATVLVSGGSGPASAGRPVSAPAVGVPAAKALSVRPAADGTVSGEGITVSGSGSVLGTPDTMRLSMGVSSSAADVSTALTRANSSISAVTKALTAKGVDAKDIGTSGLTIGQDFDSKGHPSGYRVDESIDVVLHDLTKAGAEISAAVDAGGDAVRVNGVTVDLSDSTALVAKAREAAFADAKARATQYATLAGKKLGDVVSLSESTTGSSEPVPYAADTVAGAATKSSAVPVSAGQATVGVDVTVVWSTQ